MRLDGCPITYNMFVFPKSHRNRNRTISLKKFPLGLRVPKRDFVPRFEKPGKSQICLQGPLHLDHPHGDAARRVPHRQPQRRHVDPGPGVQGGPVRQRQHNFGPQDWLCTLSRIAQLYPTRAE